MQSSPVLFSIVCLPLANCAHLACANSIADAAHHLGIEGHGYDAAAPSL